MWVDKHCPKTLNEVVMPEEWRKEFQSYLPQDGETEAQKKTRQDSIPSMLFTGPSGTGKNTVAHVLLNSISRFDTVELGGGNPPSVEKIRGLVDFFTAVKSDGIGLVFIDEADTMAQDAQRALQVESEKYQLYNRIILATNFPDRIGSALKSRLRVYDFGKVTKQDIRRRVEQILEVESKTLRSDVIDGIIDKHYPDIRKIIQEVERACIHHGSQQEEEESTTAHDLIKFSEGEGNNTGEKGFPPDFFVTPLTKQRIAERIADYWRFCEVQVLCTNKKIWMVWNGVVWQEYANEPISNSVLKSIRYIASAYEEQSSPELSKCLPDLLKAEDQIDSIIKFLSRLPGIYIERQEFNAYGTTKWLICCNNGILDLRTQALLASDPSLLITKCLPCDYNPEAECPKWLNFLNLIFDEDQELIQFVQRALGYSLLGANEAQCIFVMLGEKARNGKTTFLNVIKQVLGPDYYESANASTFTRKSASAKGRIPEDLHRLRTARFVGVVETEHGEQLDVALIKKIAGGDDIVSRTLYKESESYKAPYTVWLATNHMPAIDSNDFGIRRKVWVIPFEMQIPEEQIIPNYQDHLLEEREGILAWMVEGCRQYVENDFDLDPPDGVRPAYKAPDLPFKDKVNIFIETCTEKGVGFSASKDMLWRTFLDFVVYFQMGKVVDNNSHRNQFGRVMSDLGYNEGGANPRVSGETVYTGLKLRTTQEITQYLLEREQAEIDKFFDKKNKPKEGPDYTFKQTYAVYDVWTLINAWCQRRSPEDSAYEAYQMECLTIGSNPVPRENWPGLPRKRILMAQEYQLRNEVEDKTKEANAAINDLLNKRTQS